MKGWLIIQGYRLMWEVCPPLPERLFDWYSDRIYHPWYASLHSACDDCPACQALND